jgi:hypothetical protein
MVELQDQWVGLAAVRARPLAKDLEEELDTHQRRCSLAQPSVLDVAVMMLGVMLAFMGRATRAAVVVSLARLCRLQAKSSGGFDSPQRPQVRRCWGVMGTNMCSQERWNDA